MKRNLMIFAVGTAFMMAMVSCSLFGGENSDASSEEVHRVHIDSILPTDTVYICTGSGSKRFHASDTCCGLNGCRKDIRPITRAEAEKKKRTHCQICIDDEQVK